MNFALRVQEPEAFNRVLTHIRRVFEATRRYVVEGNHASSRPSGRRKKRYSCSDERQSSTLIWLSFSEPVCFRTKPLNKRGSVTSIGCRKTLGTRRNGRWKPPERGSEAATIGNTMEGERPNETQSAASNLHRAARPASIQSQSVMRFSLSNTFRSCSEFPRTFGLSALTEDRGPRLNQHDRSPLTEGHGTFLE